MRVTFSISFPLGHIPTRDNGMKTKEKAKHWKLLLSCVAKEMKNWSWITLRRLALVMSWAMKIITLWSKKSLLYQSGINVWFLCLLSIYIIYTKYICIIYFENGKGTTVGQRTTEPWETQLELKLSILWPPRSPAMIHEAWRTSGSLIIRVYYELTSNNLQKV